MKKGSRKDIELVSLDFLKQSKALGIFPTPVENIVRYSQLVVDTKTDITKIPKNYLLRTSEVLKRALRKWRGALDRREKVIYIDPNQPDVRKKFIQLHEVGHEALPWQRQTFEYMEDDDSTIDPDTKDEFEAEANYFASATLFQLDRFDEEMQKLPLEIKSPMYLSKLFGSSTHAAIRRYVEYSSKRCALLVLKDPEHFIVEGCMVRNYFQSTSFTNEFGEITWQKTLGIEWTFVQDYLKKKKFHTIGQCCLATHEGVTTFQYHYFYNTYNAFVLIMPTGEKNYSRTRIVFK
ncbi:MAG TPA: ImmA/IrrE family metallo-endopeptidase [Bacteroidia bacterium]|nr:ImmA/IrrE family metallo-endopeptidase [Bacteroidia bacterium]HRH08763.1 ImmA/IrrE family metallo-endopeptidase [Bacteroidia bacterium]